MGPSMIKTPQEETGGFGFLDGEHPRLALSITQMQWQEGWATGVEWGKSQGGPESQTP